MSLSTWFGRVGAAFRGKAVRRDRRQQRSSRGSLALCLECLEDRLAPATLHWSGADAAVTANINWSDAANWTEGTIPQNGDTLVFDAANSNFKNVYTSNDDLSALTLNGIAIKSPGAQSFTLSGGSVTINNTDGTLTSGLTSNVGATATIGLSSITPAGPMTFGSGAGTLIINSDISEGSNPVTFTGSGNIVVSGVISGMGSSSLVKNGSGTVTFNGNNTYQQATFINAGALVLGNSGALGQAPKVTVASGAALQFQAAGGVNLPASVPISIAGAGPSGGGAIESLGGNNAISGPITLVSASTIGSDGGTLTLEGDLAIALGDITYAGAGNIQVSGQMTSLSPGLLEGQAEVVQVGNLFDFTGPISPVLGTDVQLGTPMAQSITFDNSFTPLPTTQHTWTHNDTWIYSGTIIWPNDPSTPGSGTLSFAEQQTLGFDDMLLKIDGKDYILNASFTTPIGTGGITLPAGPHTFEARFANYIYYHVVRGDPAWTGWTPATGFIFRTDKGTNDPLAASKNVSDYFQSTPVYPGAPLGGLVSDPGDGSLFQTLAPSVVHKTGTGTLILSSSNPYAGGTVISGGTVNVTNVQTLGTGTVTLAGGTLSLQAASSVQAFANNVLVTANSTIEVQNNPATMGTLSIGTSTLSVLGTGPSLSSGPSLTFGDVTLTGSPTFVPGPSFGQELSLGTVTGSMSTAFAATLTVSGPGIVNVANIPYGVTLAGSGRIGQAVSIAGGGAVDPGNAPGATETLTALSGISFASGSTNDVELAGTSAGSFDQISSGGTVNLNSDSGVGATLNVSLVNGFVPTKGQSFTIIQNTGSSAISGTFAGLAEGAVFAAGGVDFTITYQGGSGHDVVLTTVIPGAADHFVITPNMSRVAAGSPVTFTVTALDANNLLAGGYTGTVKFSSTDQQAILPPSAALTGATGTFNVIFRTAGPDQTITANDIITPSISGTSNPTVTVTPLATVHFLVTAPPAFVPGKPFNFTVTAEDQFDNLTNTYFGTVHFSSTDFAASLPADVQLTEGTGIFTATLNTAGAQTLSVEDTFSFGISGTSNIIQQVSYFKVAVPTDTQTTGGPFAITVTAVGAAGNIVPSYTGKVHFASSDASAVLPPDSPLTGGVGIFNVTLNTAGSQTITATDNLFGLPTITGTSGAIITRGLTVASFTPTATGFTAAFSKPYVAANLTMYGGSLGTAPDVTLVGARVGAINGSLIIDPSNMSVTFKATESPLLAFFGSAVLPDDTYTVTLVSGSGSNGFIDELGAGLDGANNGGHANYTTTFTTSNSSKAILSIPDFGRGPDGAHTIKVPNDTAGGIPVTLSNAAGVHDVVFTLSFDPTLLAPTGAGTADSSAAGSTFTMGSITNIDATHDTVTFTYRNGTAQNGTVVLGDILANVPDSATGLYKSKEVLSLSSITVNGAAFTGVAAGALHVNAYFGDVTGNGTIDGLDVATAASVAQGKATGFAAYQLLDPAIVGDVADDISVDAGDVSDLAAFTVHLPTPLMPVIPTGLTITPAGADPTLSLSGGLQGTGGMVTVSVMLDHPHPLGSTGMTEAILALTYDPSLLNVSAADITLGSIPDLGTGWQINCVVDAATGQIAIELYSTTPVTATQGGSLVNIAFHVPVGEPEGIGPLTVPTTSVQLVKRVMIAGQEFSTEVADDESQLVLSPGLDRLLVPAATSF